MPKPSNKAYRICQLMTYYDEDIIKTGLQSALDDGLIVGAEYIFHDRDDAAPHYHINVDFAKLTRINSLIKYFDDISSEHQNTFHESIKGTREDAHKYLTHNNVTGKADYDETTIVKVGNDFVKQTNKKESFDSMSIIEDILNLETEESLIKKYGRDYVYHYDAWRSMALRVGKERGIILTDIHDHAEDIYRKALNDEYNHMQNIAKYMAKEVIQNGSLSQISTDDFMRNA